MSYTFKALLPYKAFYFFAYGGPGTVVAFLPVFSKELGLTSAEIAAIIGLPFFFVLISNPAIGYFSDKFKIHKTILISLNILAAAIILPVYYLPIIETIASPTGHLICDGSSYWLTFKDDFSDCINFNNSFCNFSCKTSQSVFFLTTNDQSFTEKNVKNISISLFNETACDYNTSIICTLTSCLTSSCIHMSNTPHSHFNFTYQFWVCLLLFLIYELCRVGGNFLADAITISRLKDKPQLYGRQRLMGSISWGIFCFCFGLLDDILSVGKIRGEYKATFYAASASYIVTAFVVYCFIPSTTIVYKSQSILKDIYSVIKTCRVFTFIIMTCIHGMIHRFIATFLLWHMKDLNASQLCMGTVLLVCAFSEIPFFFFSGVIISKLGNALTLCLIFICLCVRALCYGMIKNAWYFVPITALHGVTGGLGLANIISFSKLIAPPGTIATSQEFFGVCFAGIGGILGNLLGGIILTEFGAESTFITFAICSLICCIVYIIVEIYLKKSVSKNRLKQESNGVQQPEFQPLPAEDVN